MAVCPETPAPSTTTLAIVFNLLVMKRKTELYSVNLDASSSLVGLKSVMLVTFYFWWFFPLAGAFCWSMGIPKVLFLLCFGFFLERFALQNS